MAEADYALQSALRNGDNHLINIENVENDENVIEMDVALLKVRFRSQKVYQRGWD